MSLSPQEFKEARRKLGLSQAQLAHLLNVDARTVRRWEDDSGSRPPNPIACRVLEWLEEGFRPPDWPDDLE